MSKEALEIIIVFTFFLPVILFVGGLLYGMVKADQEWDKRYRKHLAYKLGKFTRDLQEESEREHEVWEAAHIARCKREGGVLMTSQGAIRI